MTAPVPPIAIDHLALPLPDAAAASRAADAMRLEIARLWQADRAAGFAWRDRLDTVSLDAAAEETPEALGRRLAGAIRARLVRQSPE